MYKAKDDGRDRYLVYAVDGGNPLAQISMAGRFAAPSSARRSSSSTTSRSSDSRPRRSSASRR